MKKNRLLASVLVIMMLLSVVAVPMTTSVFVQAAEKLELNKEEVQEENIEEEPIRDEVELIAQEPEDIPIEEEPELMAEEILDEEVEEKPKKKKDKQISLFDF